jgi:hypothetical protein
VEIPKRRGILVSVCLHLTPRLRHRRTHATAPSCLLEAAVKREKKEQKPRIAPFRYYLVILRPFSLPRCILSHTLRSALGRSPELWPGRPTPRHFHCTQLGRPSLWITFDADGRTTAASPTPDDGQSRPNNKPSPASASSTLVLWFIRPSLARH